MSSNTNHTDHPFLSGGGEMGELTRKKDWSKTVVGDPATWPQSLRTTLGIILNSRFPMFLWWGTELTCFYNDAYRPSLGQNGKHPSILGQPAKEAWTEIWEIIKPLIDSVLAGEGSTWSEDQLIPIYRNGKMEDVYWTFSYSPVKDETGKVSAVLVTCYESTDKVLTLANVKEREDQLNFAISAAELGTWDLDPSTNRFIGNARLKEWFGLPPESEIELSVAINNIIEKDRERVMEAIGKALQPGSDGNYEIEYTIADPLGNQERIVIAKGKALFDDNNVAVRFSGTLQDVTRQVRALRKAEDTEIRFRNTVKQAPTAITILRGPEFMVEMANKTYLELVDRKEQDFVGRNLYDSLPEVKDTVGPLLTGVYTTGEPFYGTEFPVTINRYGKAEQTYFSFVYQPLREDNGEISGIMVVATDVTTSVEARFKVEENEKRLNIIIDASGLGTWELDLQTKEGSYSDRCLDILGYDRNQPPEHGKLVSNIHPDDMQVRIEAFNEAMKTGVLYYEARVLYQDGSIHWMEAKGQVFYNKDRQPLKLLGTVRDTTAEKRRQQELFESEMKFRLLADSMPQHIWTGDREGNLNYFNESVFTYSGLSREKVYAEGWIQIVHPEDRDENIERWTYAVSTGTDFLFEHRFLRHDGIYRWQLSRAIPQKDADGNIQMWVGTSTDIEDQKTFTRELEKQVQERTGELAQKNRELEKMNTELQSFAYVSSHDLQEPLRKIQTFASRIVSREQESLSETGKDYFKRIQLAANRMQTLIEDLLAYSRTNTTERIFKATDLTAIVEDVKNDLKETLDEKHAVIESGNMCDANIIPFQFRQLFQNLIGNSVKFARPGTPPHIIISSRMIKGSEIKQPSLAAKRSFCHITLSDNGIGFDPQYSSRIFDVFQRLHGKDEYSGTGIGLAIVKKIVENHNGVITATGKLNEGARFDIYIPA